MNPSTRTYCYRQQNPTEGATMGIVERPSKTDASMLSDEELEGVSGGYVFEFDCRWEVIDDITGNVLATCALQEDAEELADAHGVSSVEVSWDKVARLRGLDDRDDFD